MTDDSIIPGANKSMQLVDGQRRYPVLTIDYSNSGEVLLKILCSLDVLLNTSSFQRVFDSVIISMKNLYTTKKRKPVSNVTEKAVTC